MKIKITESQYQRLKNKGIITEQASPFYAQEKTASGAVNPKGDYVYYAGGPIKKPQGAIDAKQLFPSGPPQGGYPKKVSLQQINNISSPLGDFIQGKTGTSLPPLPWDWQREEQNYGAFNEPLGKPDRIVRGKYKTSLPAQTNKYFYDPSQTTQQKTLNQSGQSVNKTVKGAWVAKTLANVNSWRDVPAGYYPPDYPKALEFDKVNNTRLNSSSSESTAVAGKNSTSRNNPYFRSEFPLGNSQEALKMYDEQIAAKHKQADELSKQIYGNDPVPGSDHFANVDSKNKEKVESVIRQGINVEIDQLNAAFGRYVAEQKSKGEEGYDWVGFLLTVASILPVVGQAAVVLNVGYNLGSAIIAYNKGEYTQAGLNLLFAVLPQVSTYLKGVNPLLQVAGTPGAISAEKFLAENAAKLFTELTSKLGGGVGQNLGKFANNPHVLLTLEKIIGKQTSKLSARGAVKDGAAKLDNTLFKGNSTKDNNNYVAGIG